MILKCVTVFGWFVFINLMIKASSLTIKIGSIFRASNTWRLLAAKLAVEDINNDPSVLPNTHIELLSNTTDGSNFNFLQKTCYLLEKNVAAIIGPSSSSHTKVTHALIGNLHVPQFAPTATDPTLSFNPTGHSPYPTLIKMTPPDNFQMMALSTLMIKFKWRTIAIIAEGSDYGLNGLTELQRIAAMRNIAVVSAETFLRTDIPENLDVTNSLQTVKEQDVRVVVLHCFVEYAKVIFTQARDQGMMKKGWAWLVTDGVTFTGGKALFGHDGRVPDYMTGVIGTQPPLRRITGLKEMKHKLEIKLDRMVDDMELHAAACVYDSVLAVAHGLHSLLAYHNFSAPSFLPGTCSKASLNQWEDGKKLYRSILEIRNVEGLQGPLEFNNYSFYSHIGYTLVNLEVGGFTEFGRWTLENGEEALEVTSDPTFSGRSFEIPNDSVYDLTNKTLRVVVIQEPPFVKKNPNYDPQDPKSQKYVGYCMDLLIKLQEMLNFRFSVFEITQYGRKHPVTKRWNGLVKELIDDRADVAVAPFTISHEREKVISFTKPFFDLGLTILLPRKNFHISNPLFAFLSPFDALLWMAILFSMILASVATCLCQNFTPENYHKRALSTKHKDHCPVSKANQVQGISFSETLWIGFSSLVNQTIDPGFINFPARVVIGIWWFTNVVLISAYTAKLAAVFTAERLVIEIRSIEDLVSQGIIDYGTVENSLIQEFFASHHTEIFRIAFQNMRNKNTFVRTAAEGIDKVRETSSVPLGESGRFAFIFDSPVLDFAVEQEPCNTETVELFAPQNYGFGLQKSSPYEKKFSLGILKLKKEGFFEVLYQRWFKGACSETGTSNPKSYQLSLDAMIGVFYCLTGGIGISLLVVVGCWFFVYKKMVKINNNNPVQLHPVKGLSSPCKNCITLES
ncbi:glutamate receptor 2-like [Tachypleus tridentatus]|uniref:glutamate receptor 2-like n=1 Tax=Tachypleus tridentatus TaxID=6853 RepID=UPI003FD105DA